MALPKWTSDESRAKSRRRRVTKQERHVASDIEGQAHPASGATPYKKGDASNADFLVECKSTEHLSFAVSSILLQQVEHRAKLQGKLPALHILLAQEGREYVVLRWEDFVSWR